MQSSWKSKVAVVAVETANAASHVLTRCCLASLTICSGISRPYNMLQHVLLPLPDVVSTSPSRPSWGNFIGCQCNSALNSSWQFWCTKRWIVWCVFKYFFPIFGGWLPAYLYCRPTTITIVQHRNVWGSKNSHKSGRSLIHCCWTASVEQPTSPSTCTWLWTYFHGVTEDAPVLLRTAAPSDCFCAPYKSAFTLQYIDYCQNTHVPNKYLLTYMSNHHNTK